MKSKSQKEVQTAAEGIKRVYKERVKLVEELYRLPDFGTPILRDSDLDAKPSVLFLGQYSTGKTTFIRYLLGGDYPGMNIGPEPTTDRFVAIMHNKENLVIPGNALAVRADMPFTSFNKYGNVFLSKFQASLCDYPLLENITLLDTPGVLSGSKQSAGRGYDFIGVVGAMANKADRIILCFDAHKLDISDEFAKTIEALKGNEEKIKIVLNKADAVSQQELMRVYGALMWSLGKVLSTPEVMRVYISSFWDQPFKNKKLERLFTKERTDLINDLLSLPRFATVHRLNELVKRARRARVHAHIIAQIHEEMPAVFGKEKKKREIIENLPAFFKKVGLRYNIPEGDFPSAEEFAAKLRVVDFSKFPKLNEKLLNSLDRTLSKDLPELLKLFPLEDVSPSESNPFEFQNKYEARAAELEIDDDKKKEYENIFDSLDKDADFRATGAACREIMLKSGLSKEKLKEIWASVDTAKHGALTKDEFVIALGMVEKTINQLKENVGDDSNPF